jgi:hypothetical protein
VCGSDGRIIENYIEWRCVGPANLLYRVGGICFSVWGPFPPTHRPRLSVTVVMMLEALMLGYVAEQMGADVVKGATGTLEVRARETPVGSALEPAEVHPRPSIPL